MWRFACAMVALVGCDEIFDIEPIDLPPDFDRCDPQPLDVYRYALARSATRLTFETANNLCVARGMELLVINDEEEREYIRTDLAPSWPVPQALLGATDRAIEGQWVASDGCAMIEFWAANENVPPLNTTDDCASVKPAPFEMHDGTCDGGFGVDLVDAACETPRYPSMQCRDTAPRPQFAAEPMKLTTLEEARAACTMQGGRLLEINTGDELSRARQTAGLAPFWVDATFVMTGPSMIWKSASGCPVLLPFGTTEPTPGAAPDHCVSIDPTDVARVTSCIAPAAIAVCE